MSDVVIPDVGILIEPPERPRNTRYTARASKMCAKRGGHDWGLMPVSTPLDPRAGHASASRPGDTCQTCGRNRHPRLNWDTPDAYSSPRMANIAPKKYQDRSKYNSDGRRKRGARRG